MQREMRICWDNISDFYKRKSEINPCFSTSSQFHSVRLFCFLQSDSKGGCVSWEVCLSGTLKFRWRKIDQKSDFQHYCPWNATIQPLSTPAHLQYCPFPPVRDYRRNHYESCGGTKCFSTPLKAHATRIASFPLVWAAVYTLGEDNFFLSGFYWDFL